VKQHLQNHPGPQTVIILTVGGFAGMLLYLAVSILRLMRWLYNSRFITREQTRIFFESARVLDNRAAQMFAWIHGRY
jgi:hypothetical protein